MKILIPILTLLVSLSANASHYVTCDVSAEVVNIQKMDRLNDSTTNRRTYPPVGESNTDERVTIATIKIEEVSSNDGMLNCQFTKGQEITLFVKAGENNDYKVGSSLSLNYTNVGDSFGGQTTWEVK